LREGAAPEPARLGSEQATHEAVCQRGRIDRPVGLHVVHRRLETANCNRKSDAAIDAVSTLLNAALG
jgi:hypothetical protein